LSTNEYESIVDQLIAAQVFQVALGGGEVLMRQDCLKIISKMSIAGIHTMLTTNGWFVDNRMAQMLADTGLRELYVSLDSRHADKHDNFRRRPGSYERVMRALKAAVSAGLTVNLSTVLTSTNIGELASFVEFAERERLSGINFKRFRPAGNGLLSKERYQLQDKQGQQIENEIARLQQQSTINISLNYGPEVNDVDSGCSCGIRSLAFRPNGDVSLCAYTEAVIGNLMRTSLSDLWINSPELKAKRAQGGCTALIDQPIPSNPYIQVETLAGRHKLSKRTSYITGA